LKKDGLGINAKPIIEKVEKGLRDEHVVKIMHVKEQLFVIAYQDFVFDLVDMDKLIELQTAPAVLNQEEG